MYDIPYKSLTKELLIIEQFYYYSDDYRYYIYFKPTLVKEAYIEIVVKGYITSRYKVRVNQFNNIFELKRFGLTYMVFITVNDHLYILNIEQVVK